MLDNFYAQQNRRRWWWWSGQVEIKNGFLRARKKFLFYYFGLDQMESIYGRFLLLELISRGHFPTVVGLFISKVTEKSIFNQNYKEKIKSHVTHQQPKRTNQSMKHNSMLNIRRKVELFKYFNLPWKIRFQCLIFSSIMNVDEEEIRLPSSLDTPRNWQKRRGN